jgi:hypothetical protein
MDTTTGDPKASVAFLERIGRDTATTITGDIATGLADMVEIKL